MKVLWSDKIDIDSSQYFSFQCSPFCLHDYLYFAYESLSRLTLIRKNIVSGSICRYKYDLETLTACEKKVDSGWGDEDELVRPVGLSRDWEFRDYQDNGVLLDLAKGKALGFSNDFEGFVELNVPPKDAAKVKEKNVIASFNLRYNGKKKLECFNDSGELIWVKKLNGWIYTSFEFKKGVVYFGTAGGGGCLYGLSLFSGEEKLAFNNGDSSNYCWQEENLITVNKKRDLVMLDSQTGKEKGYLNLKGYTSNDYLVCHNDLLFTVLKKKDNSSLKLVCIQLEC